MGLHAASHKLTSFESHTLDPSQDQPQGVQILSVPFLPFRRNRVDGCLACHCRWLPDLDILGMSAEELEFVAIFGWHRFRDTSELLTRDDVNFLSFPVA
jgi:hypothetical protein